MESSLDKRQGPTIYIAQERCSQYPMINPNEKAEQFVKECIYASFCLLYQVYGVLMASMLSGLPSAPPVDHVLSELSTVTRPSCVALHGVAHGFIELLKPLHHDAGSDHEGVACAAVQRG